MDFNRLTMLRGKLEDDVNRLEELKDMKYRPSAPIITGLPKSSSFSSDGGRVARVVTEISVMEETVMDDKIRIVQELKRLELLISDIPDSRVRIGLTMHYISGKQWGEIHKELKDKDSADALKHCCNRYLKT